MVVTSDDDETWLDPRAAIAGIGLVVVLVVLSVDTRLGVAAGTVFLMVGTVWLYLALRYGSLRRGPPSTRNDLAERIRQQASNRRVASARSAESEVPLAKGADGGERA